VAGGGIVGLSVALELAAAGRRVTVFERGRAMQEASGAAAGMLAAGDPENPAALRPLARLSRALYRPFLQRVTELSGIEVPVRTTRTIQGVVGGVDHEGEAGGERRFEGRFELDAFSLNALAPGIEGQALRFFLLEEESIDPRDLARALPPAVRAAGVTLLEECPVLSARHTHAGGGSKPVELTTPGGSWTAETLIHATGAWTEQLTGVPCGPRKGQMVQVELDGDPQLELVLRTPEIYLVPRGHGRIVVGATVEQAGFDKHVDDVAIAGLLETAAALWPPLRRARVVESWAGLRPASPDGLPVIDALANCSAAACMAGNARRGGAASADTWLAAGHFRNGILLAPATARLLREMIEGGPTSLDPAPFRCDRFAFSSVQ
jgi:glycine oxidase